MTRPGKRLIWIDLEMTGLDTDNDTILEIATVVTESNLDVVSEGPNYAIHQDDEILNGMDDWNKNCLLYTSPSPRDLSTSRMPSSA